MRIYSVGFRLDTLIHSNWQREAAAVLERRKNGEEEGPVCCVYALRHFNELNFSSVVIYGVRRCSFNSCTLGQSWRRSYSYRMLRIRFAFCKSQSVLEARGDNLYLKRGREYHLNNTYQDKKTIQQSSI